MFSDVLMTVDFDRTMTGPDSKIPQRNLDAVAFFMENGGSFTINTGRSVSSFRKHLDKVPVNAPILLYNGSARWEDGHLTHMQLLDMDLWETVDAVQKEFPGMNLEIQGVDYHYLINPTEDFVAFYDALKWNYKVVQPGEDLGPFMKFALAGSPRSKSVATLFDISEKEDAAFDAAQQRIMDLWGDKVVVYRAAPRIIDVHAKGVSKIAAARQLQAELGKKILVCAGDAENDIPMLEGADYAFCPADGVVANRFETVCNCADGAIADIIYKKIPEILGLSLDIPE
jgi:HAD superfamily hydrolase (TIGR01484 family)